MTDDVDFDLQTAWLRRFQADAQGNLRAFGLRLQEAMPGAVTLQEKSSLFSRKMSTTGVTIQVDQNRYILQVDGSRLVATLATVVRGIAISTKRLDPADWFARLAAETRSASESARALSQSISTFMAS